MSEDDNKTEQIWSRITKDELSRLDAAATAAHMSRSSFIHFCIAKVLDMLPGK